MIGKDRTAPVIYMLPHPAVPAQVLPGGPQGFPAASADGCGDTVQQRLALRADQGSGESFRVSHRSVAHGAPAGKDQVCKNAQS